ncbi:MAG: M42 family peptidase [Chloroflexi bacterium]|nr:MAG: M42 family peptidase [Chloroflexota bacterium]RLC91124.1 MAG: M42 family peptidase [Chloroflexota bacterium]
MRELIRSLVETYGPSGAEEQIRATIRAEVESFADEVRVDPLGSLVVRKQGSGEGKRIVLAAHMDEVGVMVTYVDEKGFARFTHIGGVSPLTCIGARVAFADGRVGVVGLEEKREDTSKVPKFEQLYIDVGATGRDDCPVHVGDAAVFVRPFVAQGTRLIAKAMDDRIGCAVLIETLRRLERTPHDVYFVFSVQEETTLSGARTSTYSIEPDLAIAVDVTGTGDTPECHPMAVELGKGPAVKVQDRGMIAHPSVRDLLVQRAKEAGIPYQLEVLERGTTDAAAMQLVRAGVPSGCLSIPCRYIHSPSEMVDEGDVENSVRLLLEVLRAA